MFAMIGVRRGATAVSRTCGVARTVVRVHNGAAPAAVYQYQQHAGLAAAYSTDALAGVKACASAPGDGDLGSDDVHFFTTTSGNGVRCIYLNAPKALNALNGNMVDMITPVLRAWNDDGGATSAVVMTSVGHKAFCAGGDIVQLVKSPKDSDVRRDFFADEYTLNHAIGTLSAPHVAIIDGITMGGGVGLSVHGRYRVCTETTVFAMPETAIGFFCDVGGSHFLSRLHGELGTYLALTGHRLKGVDVKRAGVATHYVDSERLPALMNALWALEGGSDGVGAVLDEFDTSGVQSGGAENAIAGIPQALVDSCFAEDTVEGVYERLRAAAAGDGDDAAFAGKCVATLDKMSPTSLKVVLRQLREGATKDLAACLEMEYRISQRMMQDNDFDEGVSALLITKTSPQWRPAALADVSQESVDAHFAPFADQSRELVLRADAAGTRS